MGIEAEQRTDLREALQSAFPNRAKLEMMLSETLSKDLRDTSGDTYSEIVFDLIQTAEAEGWLLDLLVGARLKNPGNPKLKKFIVRSINSLFDDDFASISPALGRQLIQLLQQVASFDIVVQAVYLTLPHGFEDHCVTLIEELKSPSLPQSLRIFALLKLLLKDYPQIGVFSFVNQLLVSQQLERETQQVIQQWFHSAQRETGQVFPRIQGEQPNVERNPYLLVTVYQPIDNELWFRLTASFSLSGSKEDLEPFGATEVHETKNKAGEWRFINTRIWMNQLLDQAEVRFAHEPLEVEVRELTLEVFLHLDHLLEAIDQWNLESEPGVKVGRRYRVVMRSYDRHFNNRFRWLNLLKRNWRQMQQDLNSEVRLQAERKLFEHLNCFENCQWERLELALAKTFGLKLTCVPSEKEQSKLFLTIFQSGAPIVFWTRCAEVAGFDLCTEMDRFLTIDLLRNRTELLEQIRRERESAYAASADHLGNHLAILWDDPSRVPATNPLQVG